MGDKKSWRFVAVLETVGVMIILAGLFVGGIEGSIVAGLGALMTIVVTIRYFPAHALVGIMIGAVLGAVFGYYTNATDRPLLSIFAAGMLGYLVGGNVGLLLNKKKMEAALESYLSNRSETKKGIDTLKNILLEVGRYGVDSALYQHELFNIQDNMRNIRYNEHSLRSLIKASSQQEAIKENVNALIVQIRERRDTAKSIFRRSGSLSEKKKASPYAGKDNLQISISGYESIFLQSKKSQKERPKEAKKASKRDYGPQGSKKTDDRTTHPNKESDILSEAPKMSIAPSNSYKDYLPEMRKRGVPKHIKRLVRGFNLNGEIKSGAFSDIYDGIDPQGRRRAVTVPRMERGGILDQRTRKKIEVKAENWKKLVHANIVKVYESNTRNKPYIVTEPTDGGTLDGLIKGHPLSLEEVMHIMQNVLDGMSYAHNEGIVHRNLNPENIFFTKDGIPKIGDWGIGKTVASAQRSKSVEDAEIYAYSAPEEFDMSSFGNVDCKTDVYQLGVLFYELLTRQNPFRDPLMIRIISKVLKSDPKPPSSINPAVPAELDEIVLRALHKDKYRRWENAGAMYDTIRQAIDGMD